MQDPQIQNTNQLLIIITMDINQLSAQELSDLAQQIRVQKKQERLSYEQSVTTYKQIASQAVTESFPAIEELSTTIAKCKRLIRDNFSTVIRLKAELYGTKDGQQSHQFISEDGTCRIRIGYNVLDNYDDTADAGIEKVRHYIRSLASDDKSQILVDTVIRLLSRDGKGTLKASRVLQLQQMADRSGDDGFQQGVKIIRDAYQPLESKSYVRAEYKNEQGAWISVPLSITDVE